MLSTGEARIVQYRGVSEGTSKRVINPEKCFIFLIIRNDVDLNRRSLLRGAIVVGGGGFVGCNTRKNADDTMEGLARVEFANYDTTEHTLDVTLLRGSEGGDVVVEQTVILSPATIRTDGEREPTEEWVSDIPEQTGKYLLKWSMDGGDQETYQTEDIQGCMIIRVEIANDGKITPSLQGSVDCYGQ
ncbi:hypothetical protein [Halosimplex halobium]|uniref:hypothetical protein n=1 Tax=Halosimplex halobium TaxID=3396618 RepID=UPI003F564D5E